MKKIAWGICESLICLLKLPINNFINRQRYSQVTSEYQYTKEIMKLYDEKRENVIMLSHV